MMSAVVFHIRFSSGSIEGAQERHFFKWLARCFLWSHGCSDLFISSSSSSFSCSSACRGDSHAHPPPKAGLWPQQSAKMGWVCPGAVWSVTFAACSRAGLTHLDEHELPPSAELCCHRWQRCWHVHPLRCIAQETSRDCVNLIIALATDGWLHNQRNYKTHQEQTQEEKPDQWYLKALKQV